MSLVHCYNLGCGSKFNPEENTETSCTFHPGKPVFHDAKKTWSCCSKYSTDFSDFLNIKGCTNGKHNDQKPLPDESPKPIVNNPPQKIPEPKPIVEIKPKVIDPTMREIKFSVHPNLAKCIEDFNITKEKINGDSTTENEISIGTKCQNSGCKSVYNGPASDSELCLFHPGAPIFHEGAKYWTCCNRKTTDFNAFLEQKGCETGRHNWLLKDAESTNIMAKLSLQNPCRMDFFQIANTVTLQIFAKNILPDTFVIKASSNVLSVSFSFNFGKSSFAKEINLYGSIIPEESSVNILTMKLEINLKKAESINWPKLEAPVRNNQTA